MRGPAGRRVTRDGMHYHQIQFAISVEMGCRYCGRIESRSVREQSWCVECPRACPCEQCEAQLRTVQCDYQIHLSVAVEVPWATACVCIPIGKSVFGRNVPSPFPNITDTALPPAPARSAFPSALRSSPMWVLPSSG